MFSERLPEHMRSTSTRGPETKIFAREKYTTTLTCIFHRRQMCHVFILKGRQGCHVFCAKTRQGCHAVYYYNLYYY
jgi:hypothetical protein